MTESDTPRGNRGGSRPASRGQSERVDASLRRALQAFAAGDDAELRARLEETLRALDDAAAPAPLREGDG